MATCTSCGQENPEGDRFCPACGARLAPPAEERRRQATILFCDLSGSTALAEQVDAESTRAFMLRYFAEMRTAIERHGGTVEKFIGDAVMAVFGVPQAHEDDALRAVRAATEMQRRMAHVNADLEPRLGMHVAIRIGINTGEVVAGDATARQAIVSGDAVNVAARLEQLADRDEILLGAETYALVCHAVVAESTEPLRPKGKAAPLPAFRLLDVRTGASARAPEQRRLLVGRRADLVILRRQYDAVVDERRCARLTVVGEAGVGKSALTAAFVDDVGDTAIVLAGRCLPYGEGITFWPIGEVVRAATGITPEDSPTAARRKVRRRLGEADHAALAARRVAQAVGLQGGQATTEEIAWAVGRLVEETARARPVVLIIDDLHWAEPALLDLVDALPALIPAVSVLLLCLARPELLELRPAWDVAVRLERLGTEAIGELLVAMAGDPLPPVLVARIAHRAGGNPLFAAELLRRLIEHGHLRRQDGVWIEPSEASVAALPVTLQALLGARLDRLAQTERAVVERGAVQGEVFHGDAVASLSASRNRPAVQAALDRLVTLDVVRPVATGDAPDAAGAEFRFHHLLLRDVAYGATTKTLRAELHERFAAWLTERWQERLAEVEPIVGHHLAEAGRYRDELGLSADRTRTLARRAAEHLGAAGRRAFDRSDLPATVALLDRAASLLPDAVPRRHLLIPLGVALRDGGDLVRAETVLRQAAREAEKDGDRQTEVRASLELAYLRMAVDPAAGSPDDLEVLADAARSEFERLGDAHGQAMAWRLLAEIEHLENRFDRSTAALRRALELAERCDAERLQAEVVVALGLAAVHGPTPVTEGIALCTQIRAAHEGNPFVSTTTGSFRATFEAMAGRVEEARSVHRRTREGAARLGLTLVLAGGSPQNQATIEMLAGEPGTAERILRDGLERLTALGATGFKPTLQALLAQALYAQGRFAEADEAAGLSEVDSPAGDRINHIICRGVRAKVAARRGDPDGERLAREAVALAAATDGLTRHGDALMDLAEVLTLTGKDQAAAAAAAEALLLYERKGHVVGARNARTVLRGLPTPAGVPARTWRRT